MTSGHNTAWILSKNSLYLASTNQLAPTAVPFDTDAEENDGPDIPIPETEDAGPGIPFVGQEDTNQESGAALPRRSTRACRAPDRFSP